MFSDIIMITISVKHAECVHACAVANFEREISEIVMFLLGNRVWGTGLTALLEYINCVMER